MSSAKVALFLRVGDMSFDASAVSDTDVILRQDPGGAISVGDSATLGITVDGKTTASQVEVIAIEGNRVVYAVDTDYCSQEFFQ